MSKTYFENEGDRDDLSNQPKDQRQEQPKHRWEIKADDGGDITGARRRRLRTMVQSRLTMVANPNTHCGDDSYDSVLEERSLINI